MGNAYLDQGVSQARLHQDGDNREIASPATRTVHMAKPEDTLIIETTKGRVTVEMRPDLAPGHVARIKELARKGFYDGVVFHRVIDGFMAQTGDPTGSGMGGSGQKLKAEFNRSRIRAAPCRWRARSPQFRRQPVLHRLRRRELSRQQIYGVGPRDRRHGECRQDHSRRAAGEAGQDTDGAGRRRRRVRASPCASMRSTIVCRRS